MSGSSRGGPSAALFLLPTPSRGLGPVAAWISTAQWARAAERLWGAAWILGPSGPVDAAAAAAIVTDPAGVEAGDGWRRRVPTTAKTAAKDVRRWRDGRRFRPDLADGPWHDHDLAFVWQRHEPFVDAGPAAAAVLGCPAVLFVPAPVAWEARRWGVRRPGWEGAFVRWGETPSLQAADVVACGSDVVADVVVTMGVASDRIVVTPNGVDVHAFAPVPAPERHAVRRSLGVGDRFVVGWAGSFRRFHALDVVVDAAAAAADRVDDLVLLLVGDGPERAATERRARDLGVDVVATGTQGHDRMSGLLAAMDVAVVAAPAGAGDEYHYSPLKLWEYLASAVATIAPATGQPARLLTDGTEAILVEPGSVPSLAEAIVRLAGDPAARAALAGRGRQFAVDHLSWESRLADVHAAARR